MLALIYKTNTKKSFVQRAISSTESIYGILPENISLIYWGLVN